MGAAWAMPKPTVIWNERRINGTLSFRFKSAVGCGLGGGLYSRLMTLLKAQGVLSVFGCVTSPNPPSDRLHKRMGFKLVGTYLQAGFKNGAWHDVNWYQKMLGDHLDDPKPPVPLSALEKDSILEVLTGRHLEF